MKLNGYQIISESLSNEIESPIEHAIVTGAVAGIFPGSLYLYYKRKERLATDPEVKYYYQLMVKLSKNYSKGIIPGAIIGTYTGTKLGGQDSLIDFIGTGTGILIGIALTKDKKLAKEIIELRKKLKSQGKI